MRNKWKYKRKLCQLVLVLKVWSILCNKYQYKLNNNNNNNKNKKNNKKSLQFLYNQLHQNNNSNLSNFSSKNIKNYMSFKIKLAKIITISISIKIRFVHNIKLVRFNKTIIYKF
jgi:hypothetical protein